MHGPSGSNAPRRLRRGALGLLLGCALGPGAVLSSGCRRGAAHTAHDAHSEWACPTRASSASAQLAQLRVVRRLPPFDDAVWSQGGRYLFLPADRELLVLDSHSGERIMQVPRFDEGSAVELGSDLTGELNLRAKKLLISAPKGGARELAIYDVPSGALLKSYRGYAWSFSDDGSRLALTLAGSGASSDSSTESILDSCTLAQVGTLSEPGPLPHQGVYAAGVAADGVTLGVVWSRGLTLLDLHSGRTEQLPFGQQLQRPPGFWSEAKLIAWRLGEQVSVWDADSARVTSFVTAGCSANTPATLSPDAKRVALGCANSVEVWDVASRQRLARADLVSAPSDISWLAGGRGLALQVATGILEHEVLNLATQKLVALARPGEQVQKVAPLSRLVTLAPIWGNAGQPRAVYLDASLGVHELPSCVLAGYDIAEAETGVGVVSCVAAHGKQALIFDSKTLAMRRFPVTSSTLRIEGDVLVELGATLALRRLRDGALLPGSPHGSAEISRDSWWQGKTLIALLAGAASARVSHFEPTLAVESQVLRDAPACSGPDSGGRGELRWNMDPPYTLCDRRTGRALGEVPPDVANDLAGFEGTTRLDVGPYFLLSGELNPRLFRRDTWRAIPFEQPPREARLVSAKLVAGSDADGQIGLWSAEDGKRLARFSPLADAADEGQAPAVPLAADLDAGLLVLGSAGRERRSPTLYDFRGKRLGALPLLSSGDVHFVAPGVLSVVERSGISFWRVPELQRLGTWLTHAQSGQSAFLAESGEFEITGELSSWRDVLRCERGTAEVPLEVCAGARLLPGLAARTLF